MIYDVPNMPPSRQETVGLLPPEPEPEPESEAPGCTRCTKCNCMCAPDEPRPYYYKGKDVFTGFVSRTGDVTDGTLVFLDDVGGPLNGPGHLASAKEATLAIRGHGDQVPWMSGTLELHQVHFDQEIEAMVRSDASLVKGPFSFTEQRPLARRAFFDAIRAGDSVFVCVEGEVTIKGRAKKVTECFWCFVYGIVPSSGTLVVEPAVTKLKWLDLDVDDTYRLPHTAVLAQRKGIHWARE